MAGWITLFLGALHTVLTLVLAFPHLVGGQLWFPPGGLAEPSKATAMFWISLGSFGVPFALLGAMVLRAGERVPAFVGWGIAVWALVCAAILEPTPFVLAVIPGVLLIRAARKS
ncbi:hypothetical protein [Allokutzneria albata]|uniref:hypothetical protein n=1 Tax=Allokutzneria albata TaxID=211114 RepID=UPI00069348C8|nr:hypothetical protein [Allokutzneria albata]